MTKPPSRQAEAYEANGWPNEVAERAAESSPHIRRCNANDPKITQVRPARRGGRGHVYINGRVGGIMFWAVNEGASGGPNGNGQTTGANSVALANYAAAL